MTSDPSSLHSDSDREHDPMKEENSELRSSLSDRPEVVLAVNDVKDDATIVFSSVHEVGDSSDSNDAPDGDARDHASDVTWIRTANEGSTETNVSFLYDDARNRSVDDETSDEFQRTFPGTSPTAALDSLDAIPENGALVTLDDLDVGEYDKKSFDSASSNDLENEPTVISKTSGEINVDGEIEDPDNLKPGSKFGQFTIVRFIGGGGMGRVYEGEDKDLERKVAIKVLPKKRAQDDVVVARFLNEAKSAARLNHENIAQVYLSGNVNGVPFIAFEFVEGTNLRDYVRAKGVLELDEAIDFVLQAAAALAHAALHGVTHRDVKPSNIIVTPNKRVKLIDMGLARLIKREDDDLTESGVTLGTFDYISPEQARDPRLADVRSDVYSLGCTFYYMLVGAPPFPEGTMLQKLLQHQGDEAPDVRIANPNVPSEVAVVVKKMMKKNPNERYQDPDALIADLVVIAEMIGLRVSNRRYIETTSDENKSVRAFLRRLPGYLSVLTLGVVVTFYYYSVRKTDLTLPLIETPISQSVSGEQLSENNQGKTTATFEGGAEGAKSNAELNSNSGVVVANGSTNGENVGANVLPSRGLERGQTLDGRASESIYARAYQVSYTARPVVLTDDGREWRNTFLSEGESVATTKQVENCGWRVVNLEPEWETCDYLPETTLSVEDAFYSITAYSTLGSLIKSSVASANLSDSIRVVDGSGESSDVYASLQSALSNAVTRDSKEPSRIELKFNGALPVAPISLVDRNVEIFASEGYRPVLRFDSSESSGGEGNGMFLLNSSSLTLRGVSVEFTVPSQEEVVASKWSVFEGSGTSSVSLLDSSLTVCNMRGDVYASPLHSNVAVFRAPDGGALGEASSTSQPFSVRLENVLSCGEATLFVAERVGSSLEAKKCCFNVSGAILHFIEGEYVAPREDARFTLNLSQSIAISRSCFLRIDSEDVTELAPEFEITMNDSIVRLNDQALSLIHSPAVLDEGSFVSKWKLNGVLTLDVSTFYRRRDRRTEPYRDVPFEFKEEQCETARLNELSVDANSRLENIPPHLFSFADFTELLLEPVRTSSVISTNMKGKVEAINNEFVDVFSKRRE